MERAAVRLIGTHDFAAFAGGGEGVPWSARQQRPRGTTRTVFACDAVELAPWWGPPPTVGQLIEIRVAADGFLPRMVRTIVGTLVEIGRGARPVDWIDELLIARDRRRGAPAAPPRGLVLWSVDYDDAAAADGRDAHPVAPSEAEGSF
jgi:tRNA pseudouridine38-40 synthase